MAHRIDFKAIKEAASFERVLAHYAIEHHGRGDQRKALCPFHRDTKPSLNVNFRKKVFNCYVCTDAPKCGRSSIGRFGLGRASA